MQVVGGSLWLFLFLRILEIGMVVTMTIFWLRSMHRALEACHPVSRSAEPASVWLIFIPLFGFFWQFITNTKISESLAREYHRRGWHSDENRPALELGIVAGVVICIVVLIRAIFAIHPGFGFIGTLAVCFVMYRHMDRLNSYRERLEKEIDPSVAFGQIPVVQMNLPPIYANVTAPPLTNPAIVQQPVTPAYENIPFAPVPEFVPVQNAEPPLPYVPAQNAEPPLPYIPGQNQLQENDAQNNQEPPQKNGDFPDELQKWMPRK